MYHLLTSVGPSVVLYTVLSRDPILARPVFSESTLKRFGLVQRRRSVVHCWGPGVGEISSTSARHPGTNATVRLGAQLIWAAWVTLQKKSSW